jgi:chemotaxis protein MotB
MSQQKPDPLPVQPIIIKKQIVHAGHHGGAWKAAYADFLTAMMALFIVLWLLGSSEPVKKAVAGYFRDPAGHGSQVGTGKAARARTSASAKDDMHQLRNKLEAAMKQAPELAKLKDQVQMTATGEGLRIELLESDVSTFFESGNFQPTDSGEQMLRMLASEPASCRTSC